MLIVLFSNWGHFPVSLALSPSLINLLMGLTVPDKFKLELARQGKPSTSTQQMSRDKECQLTLCSSVILVWSTHWQEKCASEWSTKGSCGLRTSCSHVYRCLMKSEACERRDVLLKANNTPDLHLLLGFRNSYGGVWQSRLRNNLPHSNSR